MCLSTVYRNQRVPETIVMKNVMRMEVCGEKLIFTDLMERKLEADGNLDSCGLTDNWILIRTAQEHTEEICDDVGEEAGAEDSGH